MIHNESEKMQIDWWLACLSGYDPDHQSKLIDHSVMLTAETDSMP